MVGNRKLRLGHRMPLVFNIDFSSDRFVYFVNIALCVHKSHANFRGKLHCYLLIDWTVGVLSFEGLLTEQL